VFTMNNKQQEKTNKQNNEDERNKCVIVMGDRISSTLLTSTRK